MLVNCDMGKGYGICRFHNDSKLMPSGDLANFSCRFHAFDFDMMRETIRRAKSYGVAVGAHPSLPDRQGFGRREMTMPREELANCIIYDDSLGQLGVGPVRMAGLGIDAPIRKGLYLANQTVGGICTGRPKVAKNCEVPFYYYQGPPCISGAEVFFAVVPVLSALGTKGGRYLLGLYNTYVASQLTWDLGGGLGVEYKLGGCIPTDSEVGYNIDIIEQRTGLSHVGNDWNLTARFQYETPLLGSKFTGLELHDFFKIECNGR